MEPLEPTPEADESLAPAQLAAAVSLAQRISENIRRAVKVKDEQLSHMIVSLLSEGHVLVEDYPGVGKTALARALSRSIECQFARVQCTADLLPADIVGTNVYNQREQRFEFRPGPIFANVVLVDEINRASPKTQSGLLECMQERGVTVDSQTHPLERPFLVLATQNPVEYEGTYPLPEAQRDRFLVHVAIGYPDAGEERAMLRLRRHGLAPTALEDVQPVVSAEDLRAARAEVDATEVTDEVIGYVVDVVRRTRELPAVSLGASPRAAVHLLGASKAAARLAGRTFVTPDDVARMAAPVLRHRLVLTPEAELERATPPGAIRTALEDVPVPR
jgi:MoxR-like ATPase